ncbi:MAG: hypothetical protein Q8P40_08145, partial [Nitrospirota bacterium]|nr:hypothetical protein [Nitrospirota bacterium]
MKTTDLLHPEQRRPSKAYLVNELRKAVFTWRKNYDGATPTTKRLLQFWFNEDHLVNSEPFKFWFCQREGIKFAVFDPTKSLNLTTIFVDENKLNKDIEIPILSPRILIREFNLDKMEIDNLPFLNIPLENKILEMEYIAVDMLKGVEVIKRKWDLPVPQDSKSVIAYYTDQMLKQLKIGGAFASFYPVVKKYVVEKLFTEKVDIDDPRVLYKLSFPEVQEQLIKLFVNAFKDMTFTER